MAGVGTLITLGEDAMFDRHGDTDHADGEIGLDDRHGDTDHISGKIDLFVRHGNTDGGKNGLDDRPGNTDHAGGVDGLVQQPVQVHDDRYGTTEERLE